MLETIRETFDENMKRVENLVSIYVADPKAQGKGRKSHDTTDILRAATVFMHATLEDLLRSIARWKLPLAAPTVLENIPLAGVGSNPKKIFLGDLTNHRGKLVDDLIVQSVDAHLERSNYNNTSEISSLLESVGVTVTKVNQRYSDLKDLMERRHQIVHRGDRQIKVRGSGDHVVRSLGKGTVKKWVDAVREFANKVFAELQ